MFINKLDFEAAFLAELVWNWINVLLKLSSQRIQKKRTVDWILTDTTELVM